MDERIATRHSNKMIQDGMNPTVTPVTISRMVTSLMTPMWTKIPVAYTGATTVNKNESYGGLLQNQDKGYLF